ncbi:MAG: baseplate J/gp47 family protein [Chloroflexi bacterium]|nr:baseplate J/gp47 family protein [Chloroflexota bacterium]
MTVAYLDVDDEITVAVARLRNAEDGHFLMVLPRGSRIATSRINFRLLEREGQARGVTVVLVSAEAGARSLAVSAGMPAYASVEDAKAAQSVAGVGADLGAVALHEEAAAAPVRIAPRSSAGAGFVTSSSATVLREPSSVPVGARAGELTTGRPTRHRARARLGLAARLALLIGLMGGALYAAYLFLPTVSITVRPATSQVGPLSVRVTADPAAAIPDAEAAVVPAQRIDIPLSANGTFAATGRQVTEERATGTVRFTSENTLFEVPIPEGTRVATADGIAFETTRTVTIPVASFATGPAVRDAPVRAVQGGSAGNVEKASISELPGPIEAQLVRVTNPSAMAGGARTEISVVVRQDYDDALGQLETSLDEQLQAALADPAYTARGLVLFPATALREPADADRPAVELEDMEATTFSLAVVSRGTVLGVDEAMVAEMAVDRLTGSLVANTRLLPDSVVTTVGEGSAAAGVITYDVSVTGERYVPLDPAPMVQAIRGRTISEARGILAAYGSVEITPWPDFIDAVPDDPRRIDLAILEPQRSTP